MNFHMDRNLLFTYLYDVKDVPHFHGKRQGGNEFVVEL